jgi:hypothetical protein
VPNAHHVGVSVLLLARHKPVPATIISSAGTLVHRAGHCAFTPGETVTALMNLIARLDTGIWPELEAADLNAESGVLGPLNVAPPSFIDFQPAQFLRPFDAVDAARCDSGKGDRKNRNGGK